MSSCLGAAASIVRLQSHLSKTVVRDPLRIVPQVEYACGCHSSQVGGDLDAVVVDNELVEGESRGVIRGGDGLGATLGGVPCVDGDGVKDCVDGDDKGRGCCARNHIGGRNQSKPVTLNRENSLLLVESNDEVDSVADSDVGSDENCNPNPNPNPNPNNSPSGKTPPEATAVKGGAEGGQTKRRPCSPLAELGVEAELVDEFARALVSSASAAACARALADDSDPFRTIVAEEFGREDRFGEDGKEALHPDDNGDGMETTLADLLLLSSSLSAMASTDGGDYDPAPVAFSSPGNASISGGVRTSLSFAEHENAMRELNRRWEEALRAALGGESSTAESLAETTGKSLAASFDAEDSASAAGVTSGGGAVGVSGQQNVNCPLSPLPPVHTRSEYESLLRALRSTHAAQLTSLKSEVSRAREEALERALLSSRRVLAEMRHEFESERDAAVRAAVEEARLEFEMDRLDDDQHRHRGGRRARGPKGGQEDRAKTAQLEEEIVVLRSRLERSERDRDEAARAAAEGATAAVSMVRATLEEGLTSARSELSSSQAELARSRKDCDELRSALGAAASAAEELEGQYRELRRRSAEDLAEEGKRREVLLVEQRRKHRKEVNASAQKATLKAKGEASAERKILEGRLREEWERKVAEAREVGRRDGRAEAEANAEAEAAADKERVRVLRAAEVDGATAEVADVEAESADAHCNAEFKSKAEEGEGLAIAIAAVAEAGAKCAENEKDDGNEMKEGKMGPMARIAVKGDDDAANDNDNDNEASIADTTAARVRDGTKQGAGKRSEEDDARQGRAEGRRQAEEEAYVNAEAQARAHLWAEAEAEVEARAEAEVEAEVVGSEAEADAEAQACSNDRVGNGCDANSAPVAAAVVNKTAEVTTSHDNTSTDADTDDKEGEGKAKKDAAEDAEEDKDGHEAPAKDEDARKEELEGAESVGEGSGIPLTVSHTGASGKVEGHSLSQVEEEVNEDGTAQTIVVAVAVVAPKESPEARSTSAGAALQASGNEEGDAEDDTKGVAVAAATAVARAATDETQCAEGEGDRAGVCANGDGDGDDSGSQSSCGGKVGGGSDIVASLREELVRLRSELEAARNAASSRSSAMDIKETEGCGGDDEDATKAPAGAAMASSSSSTSSFSSPSETAREKAGTPSRRCIDRGDDQNGTATCTIGIKKRMPSRGKAAAMGRRPMSPLGRAKSPTPGGKKSAAARGGASKTPPKNRSSSANGSARRAGRSSSSLQSPSCSSSALVNGGIESLSLSMSSSSSSGGTFTVDPSNIALMILNVPVTDRLKKMASSLGVSLTDDPFTATHVIAGDADRYHLRRTPKLMIALCRTPHILHIDWLLHSRREGRILPVSPSHHLVNDRTAEEQLGFNMIITLSEGLRRREEGGLLGGYSVAFCDGVAGNRAPSEEELGALVMAAGGTVVRQSDLAGGSSSTNEVALLSASVPVTRLLVITSDPPTEEQTSDPILSEAAGRGVGFRTTTWLFDCVLHQKLLGMKRGIAK